MTEDTVLRMDAKLASVTVHSNLALVIFYVRGQSDVLAQLQKTDDADLMLGIVVSREVATPNGTSE